MTKPRRKRPHKFFFYYGDLLKILHTIRPNDTVVCWNYARNKQVTHSFTDVKKNGEKAFTTKQVCAMLNRGRTSIEMAIVEGQIPRPQKAYTIGYKSAKDTYYWSEKDIMNLHDYLLTVHIGRPRKDGLITPSKLPNRTELRALIRHNVVYYVQDGKGGFVPTWDAEQF